VVSGVYSPAGVEVLKVTTKVFGEPLVNSNALYVCMCTCVSVCLCVLQVLVAAFAVSSYASTSTRCAHKPFNPLLGETFECVREDRGWKFISEQVQRLLS